MVAEVRERLSVSKRVMLEFHMERFNLKKLEEVIGNAPQYQVEFLNSFAAFGNLDYDMNVNRAWL
jgi:hypothetical protein